ncbi:head-tail connector protein [Conchiformibius steedae]|uniref:Phage gp6-like head-tail connector protein n=1 Tax=Conchiformibius steedae TaxID=153493 RepID=A0A3P1ZWY8_9NEIS|nr:head-tail connector protein [Conchiformibius steedae]RRD87642.1 phage gp6-like head-tail connector protein [Conchiformibius steedae]
MEKLIPLAKVKQHLRVDADDEDTTIALYRDAAIERAEQYLEAKLTDGTAADGEIALNSAIVAACLIAAAWLYERREGGDTGRTDEMPQGFYALLMPYRRLGVC